MSTVALFIIVKKIKWRDKEMNAEERKKNK